MKYLILEKNTNRILSGSLTKNINLSDILPTYNKDNLNIVEVSEEIWKQRLSDSSLNCYENGKLSVKDFRTQEEIAKENLNKQIAEARQLLDSTEFKFNDDYDLKNTPEWLELKAQRQIAREFIRANEIML